MHHFAAGSEFGPGGLYYKVLAGTSGPQGTANGIKPRLHPRLPVQHAQFVLDLRRYLAAEAVDGALRRAGPVPPLQRAADRPTANSGFGINQLTTHHHNGHNPAESDGFAWSFFFPGQYYDYRWPMILSGHGRINTDATGPKCGDAERLGGVINVAGDWHETMSTHWFHDHMLDFTAQNVYKGMAAMMNLYSALDRGREGLNCH